MPKRKTIKQIVEEMTIEIQSRQQQHKRAVVLDLPFSAEVEDDYADHSYTLRQFERTHFQGKK
jgi:hypothetical protein